ncbi:glycine/betaine ABC transporter substrate-binding protein [Pseudomonas fluorescens]|jgi:glycine betaine/proline transport system substrate-binding protein|uniref:choline ABC transporter substrate-binding protein n=1 Tax=unclassified Pseudomonas TaxID=196821 RepID=UPI000F048561|nr:MULTISPECIES: choline ABC transporter substrate-binding protein [unclassified Pseudomonas]RON76047.1 glycine/betaine ABC transporter substrate-binding protein [Pseudomonas fluorescens]KAB2520085.1 choline ABC transporter substrate-binding protein [Pseudomonas sp. GXM4]ROO08720.1 glycine/betaine ABC transporter substrate-binding protein [Pseudomonas fluorescens]ROO16585.1 glycine/betaine ABC transporter substrate-binding protein [Pseudomonas fluorescens]RRW67680.1 choline ABC transporter sub
MRKLSTAVTVGLIALSSASAFAEQSCETVKMADPGWSDIAATNAITGFLLDGMGYKAKVDTLAVPITFGGLKDGQVDVFLGNWMPAQQGFYDKFVATGDVTQLAKNLEGTEFTLAVPDYVWEAGVHDFADLNKFADKFDKKIYGIGSGAPANISLQEIIKKNDFNMGQWKLIESSEQAMLAEVSRAVKKQKFVTFLGWTPHPMNVQLKMRYLKGGEKYFGDTGNVFTLTRKGYAEACPNVGKLLTNLSFTQDMENSIMAEVVNKKVSNAEAAKAWIKANPAVLDKWLDGVKTVDGKDALVAVKAKL